MIAQISFKEQLVLTREEAEKLKLKYREHDRFGYKDDKLVAMDSYYVYKDEAVKNEDGKYVDSNGKELSNWYIHRRAEGKDWVKVDQTNQLVDLLEFALACKYPFYIEQSIKSEEPTVQNVQHLLSIIEEKTKAIDKTIDIMQSQTFNQKVNVHVGGGLIATYNELALKEDRCTDDLQCCLNNGWRIIAVCIQANQRRPDYILGRFNPKLNVTGKDEAER